ncbi:MFS transporter [Streptomyces sp. MUM 203J]|uniref:MFS transporter n=1 Tax=Streptomyces sp. MUM 203J TaxID=2791990 RepID=UPI001F03DD2F|nr:MFS transporter [Streptomyces sp. MUM 203J]
MLHLLWVVWIANSGGDLAAQDAWAEFAGRHPDTAYNLAWYGGLHPVSYSVLSPYVMAVLGVRTTMVLVGSVSAGLVVLVLARTRAVRNITACSLAAVFALLCNALSGRVTFGLGLVFALGAVAVLARPGGLGAGAFVSLGLLAGLATAASPVAGLFLGFLAAALFLRGRFRESLTLGLPPVAVVALSVWLFPFSGAMPMGFGTVVLPLLCAVAAVLLVPTGWRTLRTVAAVYAVAVVLAWAVHSPVGSNVTRLAMLFGGVVLAAALPYARAEGGRAGRRRRYALVAALVVFHAWLGFKSVDDVVRTAPQASWTHDAAPLIAELRSRGAEEARVEVVPARSHREASALAPYVNLARGWNRQADLERNPLFYDGSLTADSYREWLHRWAVRYVVLPTGGTPDMGAQEESALVAGGLPYLKEEWADDNWRLFAVQEATPLAGPPAQVEHAGAGGLLLRVDEPGRVLIRVPYSPWLSLLDEADERLAAGDGRGCLRRAPVTGDGDEWTELDAPEAGLYRLGAPYSLLSRGTPC